MKLYQYQRRARNLVLSGRPVILQAPTGAGKTRAALEPFFRAWSQGLNFPRQAIYSVPMRTLASQFWAEWKDTRIRDKNLKPMHVTIQTGEHPEDPELWKGDLIFTTIDQTLGNWLCVPYSVSLGRANLNAGAIVSSYLIFDEFHLFPLDDPEKGNGGLVTTLVLLKALDGLVPWVLMTATFSRKLSSTLAELLSAEHVLTDHRDLLEIRSERGKQRWFRLVENCLDATAVRKGHRTRSIAVCNTVDRAITLYKELIRAGCRPLSVEEGPAAARNPSKTPHVILLHSRYEHRHRKEKEKLILREFGRAKGHYCFESLILVATQIVEVGLNVTCETLHTEIAPAAAVLQRAGRCARFEEETGEVFIYDVPSGAHRHAPYRGAEEQLCEATWRALRERSGTTLDYEGEQDLIDQVHTPADAKLLDTVKRRGGDLHRRIIKSMATHELAQRRVLVRDIESRTVIVHDAPEQLGDPFRCEGFSVSIGTLKSWWDALQTGANLGAPWIAKYPALRQQGGEYGQQTEYDWKPVRREQDLSSTSLVVVHPCLISYDADLGFHFSPSAGSYRTPAQPDFGSRPSRFSYFRETYVTHVRRVVRVYEDRIASRITYALSKLEHRMGLPAGTLERTLRSVLALHDVGKLSRAWQDWAHDYQRRIGRPLDDPVRPLVHTDCFADQHRAIERATRARRPPHAVEGAVCSAGLLRECVKDSDAVLKAALMSVAKHHNPRADRSRRVTLVQGAREVVYRALLAASQPDTASASLAQRLHPDCDSVPFGRYCLTGLQDGWDSWFVYFVFVRALRLADGKALDYNCKFAHA